MCGGTCELLAVALGRAAEQIGFEGLGVGSSASDDLLADRLLVGVFGFMWFWRYGAMEFPCVTSVTGCGL